MFELSLCKLARVCLNSLGTNGYDLEQVFSPEDGEMRAAQLREKQRTPAFDLSRNDFTRSDMFWLFLRHNNADVGCTAAKVDRILPGEFPDYFRRTMRNHWGQENVRVDFEMPFIFDQMHGNVAYLGEFFVSSDHRGSRNLLRMYSNALFILSVLTLRADWMWVFLPQTHDQYGLGRAYGFPFAENTTHFWKKMPYGRREWETIAVISADHVTKQAIHFGDNPAGFAVPEDDRHS